MALAAGPGTVAALVGAGASASAGLPTAWQVRQDLIRQVAVAERAPEPADPESWWRARGEGGAGYDDLLAALAPTPQGRRDLLRGYFEPTAEERDREEKGPGAVHDALARLVADGAVQVVLTLNFDPLIETAIRRVGVEPVVLDSAAAIAGMDPLQHQRALVVHLHGHYLSPETLNTPEELGTYPQATTALVDEVFDRYGLLVLGWSAAWDTALRGRLQAARSSRYGTWWVDRALLSDHAQQLAVARRAQEVTADAGDFLSRAADAVEAIRERRVQDPTTRSAAVSYAKRALSGRSVAIPLHDTLRRDVDRVASLEVMRSTDFEVHGGWQEEYARRRDQLLAGAETLTALVATSAYWGDSRTDQWWVPTIGRLAPRGVHGGITPLIDLRLGPATLLTHAAGISACAAGRDDLVARLISGYRIVWQRGEHSSGATLVPHVLWADGDDAELAMREHLRPLLQGDLGLGVGAYDEAWERWALLTYLERHRARHNRPAHPLLLVEDHEPVSTPALTLLRRDLEAAEQGVGLLGHGNLGGTVEAAEVELVNFQRVLDRLAERDELADLARQGGSGWINTQPRYLGRPDLTVR